MTLVIVGAGGHGREVLDVVDACGLDFVGFIDDGRPDVAVLTSRCRGPRWRELARAP